MLGAMPRAGLGCRDAAALILLLVACLAAPWCARDGSARARVVARGVVLTTDLRQGSVTLAHDATRGLAPPLRLTWWPIGRGSSRRAPGVCPRRRRVAPLRQPRTGAAAPATLAVTVQAVRARPGWREGLREGTEGTGRREGAGSPWSAAMQACVT